MILIYLWFSYLSEKEKPACSSHLSMANLQFIEKSISRDSVAFDEPLLKAYTLEHPV